MSIAKVYTEFREDALVVKHHGVRVIGNQFEDTWASRDNLIANQAHRDAIQLIPPSAQAARREHFAGACLDNVSVFGNIIRSVGKLQGIFGSDGLFRNLQIIGNVIDTNSQHYISVAGLLSGWIEGNMRPDGTHCAVNLEPWRIGGNPEGKTVRVLSFADTGWAYDALENLVDVETLDTGVVNDWRETATNGRDIFLINFHYHDFRAAANEIPLIVDTVTHVKALQDLAKHFGERVH